MYNFTYFTVKSKKETETQNNNEIQPKPERGYKNVTPKNMKHETSNTLNPIGDKILIKNRFILTNGIFNNLSDKSSCI